MPSGGADHISELLELAKKKVEEHDSKANNGDDR